MMIDSGEDERSCKKQLLPHPSLGSVQVPLPIGLLCLSMSNQCCISTKTIPIKYKYKALQMFLYILVVQILFAQFYVHCGGSAHKAQKAPTVSLHHFY